MIINENYDYLFEPLSWSISVEDHERDINLKIYKFSAFDKINKKQLQLGTEVPNDIVGNYLWENLWYYIFRTTYHYIKSNLFIPVSYDLTFEKELEKHIEMIIYGIKE